MLILVSKKRIGPGSIGCRIMWPLAYPSTKYFKIPILDLYSRILFNLERSSKGTQPYTPHQVTRSIQVLFPKRARLDMVTKCPAPRSEEIHGRSGGATKTEALQKSFGYVADVLLMCWEVGFVLIHGNKDPSNWQPHRVWDTWDTFDIPLTCFAKSQDMPLKPLLDVF